MVLVGLAATVLATHALLDRPAAPVARTDPVNAAAPRAADAERLSRETRAAALARKTAKLAQTAAEPSWQEECQADPACVAWQAEQREALAEVIPARRAAYRDLLASREAVAAVKARIARNAAALAIELPVDQLFDLLSRETALAIEVDACAASDADRCREWRTELSAVQGELVALTGITMTELRAGAREPTREETLAMQDMAERQGGQLYFVREKGAGEVAPRLVSEEEAADLQATADSCPSP